MRPLRTLLMVAMTPVMAATVVLGQEFPIGQTTIVNDTNGTLNITNGGSSSGYHLYTSPNGSRSTIDSQGGTCVVVDASYTIIRGLDIGGSSGDCVRINPSVTNTVIEGNHIGAVPWGSTNYDRGISLASSGISDVVIQRNVIDNPGQNASTWATGHPAGQYAIRLKGSGVSGVVIRYNNIGSANGNRLHDGISATDGDSCDGMEIYGNLIVGVTDNGVEAEAACRNAKITGNRFDHVYRPIATAGPVVGPVLIARNVIGPNFVYSGGSHFPAAFKFKDANNLLVYHNTILHGGNPSASDASDGGSGATGRNNIIHVNNQAVKAGDWDYDLYQGSITSGDESNGINAAAQYQPGTFCLEPGSPGHDDGVAIPGFEQTANPDMGACEVGAPPLEFGITAYLGDPPDPPVCGDGIVEGGESCDGSNLNGATCQSLGFIGGSLSCSSCSFNTSNCTFDTTAPSVPQGLNAIAAGQTQIDLSWSASSDPETGISEYNIFRDGSSVGQSGSTSFSDTGLSPGTTYTYRVSAVNGAGLESAQSGVVTESTGSPAPDTTPPTITSVLATSNTTVSVVFDEPLQASSATNASNYSIDNGVAVSSASLGSDLSTVTLSTSPMSVGSYTLTVNGVNDLAFNTIASNTSAGFQYTSTVTLEWRVGSSEDDAEQAGSSVQWISSDLELVEEASTQVVGVRFQSVSIPQGALITNAYVQFQVDEPTSVPTSLVIRGQASDDAASLTSGLLDTRSQTSASSSWNPPAWNSVGAAGVDQRTPNLAAVIQEIVNRPGWSGNSLVLLISGSGVRIAEAYDGDPGGAALLHVEFSQDGTAPVPPQPPGSLTLN